MNHRPASRNHCVISRSTCRPPPAPACPSRPNSCPPPSPYLPHPPSSWPEECRILLPRPWVILLFHPCGVPEERTYKECQCRSPEVLPVSAQCRYQGDNTHYVTAYLYRPVHSVTLQNLIISLPR